MTLRKVTLENSVKYINQASSSQSEDAPKDPKPKIISLPRKQNKKFSQNRKKALEKKENNLEQSNEQQTVTFRYFYC